MSRFAQRSFEKELMDDLHCGGEELKQTLKELKIINLFLGGNRVTTSGLEHLMESNQKWPLTVADLGCGGGDMISHMASWAENKGYPLKFIGVDANPNIIGMAKAHFQKSGQKTTFKIGNVFDQGFLDQPVDICTCTLFAHHFSDQELTSLLKNLKNNTKLGIVINDLHRHPLAYHSIRWLTRWFSKSEMVKNDAPISVLRSFSKKDWENILKASGLENHKISWRWAFRWQVICWI